MWKWHPEGPDGIVTGHRRAQWIKTDDSGTQQKVDISGYASEKMTKVVRSQPHGFSSHAPVGSDGLLHALGGRSDRAVLFGGEHKDKRPRNLPEGGTALYDADGKILKIIKDKTDWDAGGKPWSLHHVTTVSIDANDVITITSTNHVIVKAPRVDLGDTGGSAVATVDGYSSKVFAVL